MGIFFHDTKPQRKARARRLGESLPPLSADIPAAKAFELMTHDELNNGGDRIVAADVESYPNYFECGFKCFKTRKVVCFEIIGEQYFINGFPVTFSVWAGQLSFVLHRFLIVTFNGDTYDLPMLFVALEGHDAKSLNEVSGRIIHERLQLWQIRRDYCKITPKVNSIDLIEIAPVSGEMKEATATQRASLKLYAGRIHLERLQDLPYAPETVLTAEQIANVRDYNINDLDLTIGLAMQLKPQIGLREKLSDEYKIDLRSRSDAQIAENVIVAELQRLGVKVEAPEFDLDFEFYYKVPDFVQFNTPQLQKVLEQIAHNPFTVNGAGGPKLPDAFTERRIAIGHGVYTIGIGGLHSNEKNASHYSTADMQLIDRDVASYYPAIILNLGLYPRHLGTDFLKVYRSIVNRRLLAKKEKNNVYSDALKITINGTFGKLGNMFSKLYSPDLLAQVTITGQLCLLMLIERLESVGIPVVSANTDGLVIACPKDKREMLNTIFIIWEEQTGFNTEETEYRGIFSRDVNSYFALKVDGGCKTKGAYSKFGSALNSPLSKNPEAYIVSLAVQEYLDKQIPIAHTILNNGDVTNFVCVRSVRGGAEKDGKYLGKAVRWYYAKGETGCINSVRSGAKVPSTDGARPCQILPATIPADIDYDYYIQEAESILVEIGVKNKVGVPSLF